VYSPQHTLIGQNYDNTVLGRIEINIATWAKTRRKIIASVRCEENRDA
jgi:hypothetical protein